MSTPPRFGFTDEELKSLPTAFRSDLFAGQVALVSGGGLARADPLMCRVLGEVYPVASASAYEERRPPAPDCWVSSRCRGRAAIPSPPTNRSGRSSQRGIPCRVGR